ncbi:MAG: hypothetical protein AMS24_02445 [Chlamydiae bacterium SM23_39]|nr:MAG: hypothetical protein AMS24_02445 [Chlamydiae bacterium SM23_39]
MIESQSKNLSTTIKFEGINYKIVLFDKNDNSINNLSEKKVNELALKTLEFHKKHKILPSKDETIRIEYAEHKISKKSSNKSEFKEISSLNLDNKSFEELTMFFHDIINKPSSRTTFSQKILQNNSPLSLQEKRKIEGSSLFIEGKRSQKLNACTVIAAVMLTLMLHKNIQKPDDINIDHCLEVGEKKYTEIINDKKDRLSKQLNEKLKKLNEEKNKYQNLLTEDKKKDVDFKTHKSICNKIKKPPKETYYQKLINEYENLSKSHEKFSYGSPLSAEEITKEDKFSFDNFIIYHYDLSQVGLFITKEKNIFKARINPQPLEDKTTIKECLNAALEKMVEKSLKNTKISGILTTGKGSTKDGYSYAFSISKNADNKISIEFADSHRTFNGKAFFVRFEDINSFTNFFIDKLGHKYRDSATEPFFTFEKFDKTPLSSTEYKKEFDF